MPVQPRLQFTNVAAVRLALRRAGGPELVREMGQVHKSIGEMVIARLGGRSTGVGAGRGEAIRPSAATREVLLRVGGSHRRRRVRQWGRTQVWPGGSAPARPYLIQAARDIAPQIEEAYLDGIRSVARRAGLRTN